MKKVSVKVLKNHTIGRIRAREATYLLDESRVLYMVKQGYVEVVPKAKKKKNENPNKDSK